MAETPDPQVTAAARATSLAQLRARIDTIDESIHRLLIERASIIETLIRVKKSGGSGSAFRPAREADMMRRLVARHDGALPIATIEHFWREIISTFTYLQQAYRVHVPAGDDDADCLQLARFQFGFTVPVQTHACVADVMEAVAKSNADLGIIPIRRTDDAPWWHDLDLDGGPRVIARLPFVQETGRAKALPALVVAPPLADPVQPEINLFAVTAGTADTPALPHDLEAVAQAPADGGQSYLIAAPRAETAESLKSQLAEAGWPADFVQPVGGYAAPIIL